MFSTMFTRGHAGTYCVSHGCILLWQVMEKVKKLAERNFQEVNNHNLVRTTGSS